MYPFVLSKEILQSIPTPYTAKGLAVDKTDIVIGVWLIISIVIAVISVFYKLMIHEYICGSPRVVKHVSTARNYYEHTREVDNNEEKGRIEENEGVEMTKIDIVV